jgi:hypothetical protein
VVLDVGQAHFDPPGQRASVDNTTWDGPAAMSACASSTAPASCYSRICAGRRTGDTSKQGTWALPHHKHPGEPPNAAGVRNALSQLPKTDGLINKAAAQQHLEAHLSAINAKDQTAGAARMRAAAIREQQGPAVPNNGGRMQAFPAAHLRAQQVSIDGQTYYHVQGYATVFDAGYEMYDMWGPYTEYVQGGALDSSLSRSDLDTAFLTNHRGVTMARTTATFRDGTRRLQLVKDGQGLAVDAYLNAGREDVRTLVSAIDDELVTEMSFAFWLRGGHWDDDYEEFFIDDADIHRGDVSAVNYGANPYTSIAARASEILADLDHLPAGAARAAMQRLQARPDVMVAFGTPQFPAPAGTGERHRHAGAHRSPAPQVPGQEWHEHADGERHPIRPEAAAALGGPQVAQPPAKREKHMSLTLLTAMQDADNAADRDQDEELELR